jgi:hypothetical protein
LWEAFLLQMDDFDRLLEIQLKLLLDPVVARRPPARKGLPEDTTRPAPLTLTVDALAVEAIPVVGPVATLPVAPARSL